MSQSETPGKAKVNLFDIRNIIGALLGIYGVVLVVVSFSTSTVNLDKVSGINANLWVGLVLLGFAAFFIGWATLRPLRIDEAALERDKEEVDEAAHRPREEGP